MDWVDKIEFRPRAKVPIINYYHRNSLECDVSIGQVAKDTSELVLSIKRKIKGNILFILSAFLKIYLYQLSLDKPFTGGLGSFKLYLLIAKHVKDFFPQFYDTSSSSGEPNMVIPDKTFQRKDSQLLFDKDINYGMILQSFLSYYGNPSHLNEYTTISLIEDAFHSNAFITFEGTKQVTSIQHAFFLASTILDKAMQIRKEIIRERIASNIKNQQQLKQEQQQEQSKSRKGSFPRQEDTVVPMILSDLAGDSTGKRSTVSIPAIPKEDYYFFEESEEEKAVIAPRVFMSSNKRAKAAREEKEREKEKEKAREREREKEENVYSLSLLGTLINARELLLERNLYSMKCSAFLLEPVELVTERKEAILSYCLKKLDIFSMKEADRMTWKKLEKLAPMLSCRLKSFSSYDRAISIINGEGGRAGGEQNMKGAKNRRKTEMEEEEEFEGGRKKGRKLLTTTATHYGLVGSQFQQQPTGVISERKLKQKKFKKRRLNSSVSSGGSGGTSARNDDYELEEGEENEHIPYQYQQQQQYVPEQPYRFLSPPPPLASSLYFPPSTDPYASSLPFSPSPHLFNAPPPFFQPPFSDPYYYPQQQQQTPFSSLPASHPVSTAPPPPSGPPPPPPSQSIKRPRPPLQKPLKSSNSDNNNSNSNNNNSSNNNSKIINNSGSANSNNRPNVTNNNNNNRSSKGNTTISTASSTSAMTDSAKTVLLRDKIIERAAHLKKKVAELKDKIPLSTTSLNVTIAPSSGNNSGNKNKHYFRDDKNNNHQQNNEK
jgi:hypothetical protein